MQLCPESRATTLQHCRQSTFLATNLISLICHKILFTQRNHAFYAPFKKKVMTLLISHSPKAALKINNQ